MSIRPFYPILFAFSIFILFGCNESPEILPEVNEINCQNKELIGKISPKEMREKFKHNCDHPSELRTPDSITSPQKGWSW